MVIIFKKYVIALLSYLLLANICPVTNYQSLTQDSYIDVSIPECNINDSFNIKVLSDGYFTTGDSNEVPHIYDGAKKYGYYVSDAIKADKEFQSAVIKLDEKGADVTDLITVEARASKDKSTWSEWQTSNDGSGEIKYYGIFNYIQYRITIISSDYTSPLIKVSSIKLKMLTSDEKKAYSQNIPLNQTSNIAFADFYRGFATVSESERDKCPSGTFIIYSKDSWSDFMGKYLPGIPYLNPVDFDKECLIFNGFGSAKPTYCAGFDVKGLKIGNDELVCNVDGDNGVYAENISGIEHVYVNVVKANKKDIPQNLKNIYK
ncbi:MAG TPA: hypothetical protein VF941_14980 [Clostridia bacterium]